MRDASWPLRRWLCDRLVGRRAYSRNVSTWTVYTGLRSLEQPRQPFSADYGFATIYDQESA